MKRLARFIGKPNGLGFHPYELAEIADGLASRKLAGRKGLLAVLICEGDETEHGHGIPLLEIGKLLAACKGARRDLQYFTEMNQELSL